MIVKIASVLTLLIIGICVIPLFAPETKIEWITYLGMPLIILTGASGAAFISKRFEAIIVGMVISALWPALLEIVKLI